LVEEIENESKQKFAENVEEVPGDDNLLDAYDTIKSSEHLRNKSPLPVATQVQTHAITDSSTLKGHGDTRDTLTRVHHSAATHGEIELGSDGNLSRYRRNPEMRLLE
jgi:hypothetical protein